MAKNKSTRSGGSRGTKSRAGGKTRRTTAKRAGTKRTTAKRATLKRPTAKRSIAKRTTAKRATTKTTKKRSIVRASAGSAHGRKATAKRAGAVGGKLDFGIPERRAEVYARQGQDLRHDETDGGGPRRPRGKTEGVRESGAGAPDSGPGSSSGGDFDPDIIGVGTGSGVAQAGPDDEDRVGMASTTGSSDEFASGPPARGENFNRPMPVRGTTHNASDAENIGEAGDMESDVEDEDEEEFDTGDEDDDENAT